MQRRRLTSIGRSVCAIGFGTWPIGGESLFGGRQVGWGPTDRGRSLDAIRRAVELGIDFFDTADIYGDGLAEVLLGETLPETRHAVVCTKWGNRESADGRSAIKDFSPAWLRRSVEASLHRLRRERIDVLLLHGPPDDFDWPRYDPTPCEDLKRRGAIGAYGVSARSVTGAARVLAHGFGSVIEVIYNAVDRRAEARVFPEARKRGVDVIARVPLASGFLTGKYTTEAQFPATDHRRALPARDIAWRVSAAASLDFLEAAPGGMVTSALRFCLTPPEVTVVIPGMRTVAQVEANTMAAELGPLPADIVDRIHVRTAPTDLAGTMVHFDPIASLADLHTRFASHDLGVVYEALYRLEEQASFTSLYARLVARHIAPLFATEILYQRKPGVRIHVPGARTVQYHADEWYGHGPDVHNFWMPLTAAEGTNSLYVAAVADSVAEVKKLEREGQAVDVIEQRLRSLAHPLTASFGDIFVFNARTVHGSETNVTPRSRVSLDFRMMLPGMDPGTKSVRGYYVSAATTGGTAPPPAPALVATAYFDMRHGISRFISSDNQRLVIKEFARKRGVVLVGDEMEIQSMEHHPMLLFLAEGRGTHDGNAVVLFSICSLPEHDQARAGVYETARAHGLTLLFANEELESPRDGSAEIEARRRRIAASIPTA